VKKALLSRVSIEVHPELVVIFEQNEDVKRFVAVTPEVCFLLLN
jgi:hypothetical protein